MSSYPALTRACPAVALFGALVGLAPGCGQGLFDRVVVDAGVAVDTGSDASAGVAPDGVPDASADVAPDLVSDTRSDVAPDLVSLLPDASPDAASDPASDPPSDPASDPASDAGGGEANNDETSAYVDKNGADLKLDEAVLSIGAGTFTGPTLVTLRRIPSIPYAGAWGPVFEISVPATGLFRQDAKLTIRVQDIGANQPNLVIGVLDPNLPLASQQWVWVSNSVLSQDQTTVTGSVSGFGNATVLQYAAVIHCPPVTTCPAGQTCNASVCQQCPTSSPCTQ